MKRDQAQIMFDKSRENLSLTLKNLEQEIKNKIAQTAQEAQFLKVNEAEDDLRNARIIEQKQIIETLNQEINSLEKELLKLRQENEFLREKYSVQTQQNAEFKEEFSFLSKRISQNLSQISQIINDEN